MIYWAKIGVELEKKLSPLPFSGVDGVRSQNNKVHDMHALYSHHNVVNYTIGDHEKLPNGMEENHIRINSDNKSCNQSYRSET